MWRIFIILMIMLWHGQSWSASQAEPEPTTQPVQEEFDATPPPPPGIAPLRPVFDSVFMNHNRRVCCPTLPNIFAVVWSRNSG
jgi:hypothetical protein